MVSAKLPPALVAMLATGPNRRRRGLKDKRTSDPSNHCDPGVCRAHLRHHVSSLDKEDFASRKLRPSRTSSRSAVLVGALPASRRLPICRTAFHALLSLATMRAPSSHRTWLRLSVVRSPWRCSTGIPPDLGNEIQGNLRSRFRPQS